MHSPQRQACLKESLKNVMQCPCIPFSSLCCRKQNMLCCRKQKYHATLNNQDNGKMENPWTSKETHFPLLRNQNSRAFSGVGGFNLFTLLRK